MKLQLIPLIKNPFEFQKQQSDKGSKQEVSQFKASKRLLNSNKSDLYFNTVKKTVTPRPIPLPRKLCNIPAIKAPSNLIFELTFNSEEEENVETKLSKPKPPSLNIPSKVEEFLASGSNVTYSIDETDTTGHEMTWLSTSQPKSSKNSNIIPIKVESKLFLENRITTIPSPTFQHQKTTKYSNLIPNEPLKMMQQHRKVESKMQPPSKTILNFSTKIKSKLDEKPEIVGKKSKAVNLHPSKLPVS
uniref:Uncharacterized protein n=1 Tax=Panagrolaimus davidi TaxID=227884 RepID=A0A914QRL3_9BILA